MRILFVNKRWYTRRDVIRDRYGRLWHLPKFLAEHGHKLTCVCAAYYPDLEEGDFTVPLEAYDGGGTLRWRSLSVVPYSPLSWSRYYRILLSEARQHKPECIVAASDAFQIILASFVARKLRVPLVADFYDNFESFGATRLPLVRYLLRKATRSAALVICVSEPLRQKLLKDYRLTCPVVVIENGVEPAFFDTTDKLEARVLLGLPQNGKFVGTAGALSRSRGIDTLFKAYDEIAAEDKAVRLVLAGVADRPLPEHTSIDYLGDLPHTRIPLLFRALDVGVIYIKDDDFGRYCFPQKAAEMAAAGLPMVYPKIGVMGDGQQQSWGYRVQAGDIHDLAMGIRHQMIRPKRSAWTPYTWEQLTVLLESELSDVVRE